MHQCGVIVAFVNNTDVRRRRPLWPLSALLALIVAVSAIYIFRFHVNHTARMLRLSDGTQAFFLGDTKLEPSPTYPHSRELRVDGDAFIRTAAITTPLIVRTRLLVLTVNSNTALRVTAFSKEEGEQVEVLYGHVQANKSYPSSYSEPDQLGAGEMSMVNRTIDLMEKETFPLAELRTWSEKLIASVDR
jgi:hypothetical protein